VTVGLADALSVALIGGLPVGLLSGLAAGLAVGSIYGGVACLRHLALRCLLVYEGALPLRYVRFLDTAADRLFLRRTGSGYLFIHRLLRDHIAHMEAQTSKAR
jgi:hypothetical protein